MIAALVVAGCARPVGGDTLAISARMPGARVTELEASVAQALEAAASGVPAVRGIRTTVDSDGVTLEVELTGAAYPSMDDLRAALQRVELPEGVYPEVAVRRPDERTITVVLTGGTPAERASTWRDLRRELLMLPGTRSAEACGLGEERVEVRLDPVAAAARGVSVGQVADSVLGGTFRPVTAAELGKIEVHPGVRVEDVAAVERSLAPADCVAFAGAEPVWVGQLRVVGPFDPSAALATLSGPVRATVLAAGGTLEYRRPPGADEVGPAVARAAPDAVVLDRRSGVGWVLGRADLAALRSLPGVAAWDPGAVRVVRVLGPDLEVLDRVRDALVRALQGQGARADRTEAPERPSVEVEVDRQRAADLGISVSAIALVYVAAVDGVSVGAVTDGAEAVAVVVQLPAESLPSATVAGSFGEVPLATVIMTTLGVDRALLRVDRERAAELAVTGASADGLAKAVAAIPLPPGYRVELVARNVRRGE